MSEALTDDTEAPDLTPDTGAPADKTADHDASGETDEDHEAEALAMGWKPESQYKGPKDKFVSAAEYVERGKTIMPFLRNELKRRDREIEGLKKAVETSVKHISRADERAYTKAKADLEAELATYAEAGNKAAVKEVTDDLIALEKERVEAPKPAEDVPEWFATWQDDNPWFGKDKPLTAATVAISNEAEAEGFTGKALAKEVDRRLREDFPSKFAKAENPNRRNASAVEGPSGARRTTGKTYADLPADARQMCDELVRDKILTREQYVKTYNFGA
jgi:hypothetical protein